MFRFILKLAIGVTQVFDYMGEKDLKRSQAELRWRKCCVPRCSDWEMEEFSVL